MSETDKKDKKIKELEAQLKNCALKNIKLQKEVKKLNSENKVMQESIVKLETLANTIEKQEEVDIDKTSEKIEQVWKTKVLEGERKVKALEKLLEEKRKVEFKEQSITLQTYIKSYKEKVERLEKELKEKTAELTALKK